MKTTWHTLYQHILALRIWWACRRDARVARRVLGLVALLEQDADTAPGRLP
jgi:hypothetical protein